MGRRMVDTAARLVDEVLPHVPVRQFVLSLPFEIRYDSPTTASSCVRYWPCSSALSTPGIAARLERKATVARVAAR